MSLLIYAESAEGKFKKVAFELASYAKKIAESLGTTLTAVTINAGDVSEFAKFSQGDFEVWFNKLINSPENRSILSNQRFTFIFIIDKKGKVKDAHIIKGTGSPEKDAVLEKILTQIPDWEPAIKLNEKVSVYYWMR